ncbi:DNA cytosine methyltransferase [Streptomyces sp. NBC_00536]|uniref:DNA cytosine methyltransferase n=1 Tax=Streptomyces sp. NBC_00536 TaxID=2975769 RepID=UPI002E8158E9|nr:DNA cytosine methyltransferase [Streptomyces sp. NBC_00536]WUC79256.1 DNA cytosine methyltransferase [Streptomyces sp. NBC_00536]
MTRTPPQTSQPGQIRVLDLFAGAGGFSSGFARYVPGSGANPFVSVAAVEFDRAAASTYAANFGGAHVHPGDIADFDAIPFKGDVDVIMGGPPCQGFSGLGKEDPTDPRNELWQEYVRVVAEVNPKLFVIENVDRFLKSAQYADLLSAARTKGHPLHNYTVKTLVMNAADYGVPQARRRVIVICTHKDFAAPLTHPAPTHDKNGYETDGADEPDAQESLFDDQPDDPGKPKPRWIPVSTVFDVSTRLPVQEYMPDPREDGEAPLVAGVPGYYRTSDLHFGRHPEPLSRARYKAIDKGGNRNDLRGKYYRTDRTGNVFISTDAEYKRLRGQRVYLSTESWDNHNSGSGDVMGRLRENKPSVTIRTEFYKPEKGRYLHPEKDRPITHYEAALIQGFPDDFKWYGTKIEIARQIGNAVPVGLATTLAKAIHGFLSPHM